MKVSFRMFNRGKLSTKHLGKKFWVPIFILAIAGAGFGIFSAVRALTPVNSTVSISSNSSYRGYSYDGEYPIYYGNNESSDWKPWSTKWYDVSGNDAMCLQASKNSPAGSGPAKEYSNANTTLLKRVMLATIPSYSAASAAAGGPNYYNLFNSYYDWNSKTGEIINLRYRSTRNGNNIVYGCRDDRYRPRYDTGDICDGSEDVTKYVDYYYNCPLGSYYSGSCSVARGTEAERLAASAVDIRDAVFAVGHMMASGIYGGDYYGISSQQSYIQGIASDINSWFANNYPTADQEYEIYVSYIEGDSTKQTVGWLEYAGRPEPLRYRICKKSTGGTMLSGATFNIPGASPANYTTGSDGCTDWIEDLDVSSFNYTETVAPNGYQLYTGTQTCSLPAGHSGQGDYTCWARDNELIPKAYIKIKKVNTVNSGVSYAGLTVVGTVFSVKSGSTEVATITIGSDGTGSTNVALPVGTYVISEKTATTGYKTNGATLTVTLNSSNTGSNSPTVDYTTNSTACSSGSSPCWFKNEPIVGKVSFTKVGYELATNGSASSRNLGGVSFTAVNKADSSITYTIGPTAANGSVTSPDMVYGNYTATEIRSDANRAYNLLSFDFSVGSGTSSLGTKSDTIPDTPNISTVARNSDSSANPQNEIEISANAGVTDRITCSGLTGGIQYQFRGELYAEGVSDAIKTATKTFTADSSGNCGNQDMAFSDINTYPYLGKKLRIKQVLYKNNGSTSNPDWVRVAIHNANLTDTNEQVTVKNIMIETVARSERTNNKQLAVGTVKIKDTYEITGMANGQNYTLKGTVKDSGGNTVATATDSIPMTLATGAKYTGIMTFEFDSSRYTGQSLYVYQELYLAGGTSALAWHNAPADGSQTVSVITPTISTVAVDNADGSSKRIGVGNAVVKDTISFTGLVSGNTYRLEGKLVRVDTGATVSTANKSFTASGETGSETVTFNITTDELIDKKLVVYESLYYGNNKIAEHAVSTDNDQTVTVKTPTVGTVAVDNADGDRWLEVSDGIVVKDTVTYDGLVAGNTYSLTMKVVLRSNPSTVVSTGSKEFTVSATSGSVQVVSAAFDSSPYVSQDLVVYEYLYHGSTQIAKHENKDDTSQIVTVKTPVISTIAVDNADGTSKQIGVGDAKVKDTIHYKELAVGKSYRLVGKLVDKASGSEVSSATISSFTPTRSEDDITMVFDITTDVLIGKDLVVYEYLYFGNNKIAEHAESTDADQTVKVKTPTVGTTAVDNSDGDKLLEVSDGIVVKDTVAYNGLVAGNTYSLTMKVVLRSNPSTVVTTGSKEFTVSATSGTVEVISTDFDSSFYVSQDLVVYEYLYHNSTQIAKHEDKDDAPQIVTVKTPEISTIAVDALDGESKEIGVGNASVTDTIHYKELAVGKSYRLEGQLVDVATGDVVATARISSFTPTRSEDDITMTFNRDTSDLLGKDLVVYERLYFGNNEIANHVESTDADQTVTVKVPTVGTVAVDNADGDRLLEVDEGIEVKDTVAYTGLIGGDTYTLTMKVVKRSDPTTVISTATKEFEASGASGTVDIVSAPFDSTTLHDENLVGLDLVVYEYLYFGNNLIGTHEDKDDAEQIVTVKTPTIETTAYDVQNRTRELPVGTTTVIDEVEYHDLVAGKSYTVTGILMDKATGEAAKDENNHDITGSTTFNATGATGKVDITFSFFDTTLVYDYYAASQKYYVAYEYLYKTNILIAKHEDLDDEAQSITINRPSLKTSATYKVDGTRLLGVGDVTMKDYVDYEGLVEGEWYMIVGSIIDPETCTDDTDPTTCDILEIDDEFIRNSKVFKAGEDGKGTVAIEINLNTVSVQGRTFVVYERLYRSLDKHGDGRLLATHEDLEDEDQTVTVKVAKIETTASDKSDDDNVLDHEDGQVIHDVIEYDGLLRDEDYILYGYLWDKINEQPLLDKDGNRIETTAAFTTPTRKDNGTIEVDFNVDAHDLPGAEIVVFEYLFQGTEVPVDDEDNPDISKVITKHDDPESASQTVRVSMRVGTTAADSYDGDQVIGVGNVEVIDTLMYEGARVGKTYKAKGWLVDQSTGEKVQGAVVTLKPECEIEPDDDDGEGEDEGDDGGSETGESGDGQGASDGDESGSGEEGEGEGDDDEEEEEEDLCAEPYDRELEDIEGENIFTIGDEGYEESNGTALIYFEFDSRKLIGKKLVVFEELYLIHDDGTEELVAEHKDLNDASQTVSVATPTIKTVARDMADNDKELANNVDSTIVDDVEYTGLVPGTTYMLYGQLMDKQTGKVLDADGMVEATHIFTPTRDAGMETLEFTISTTDLSGKEIVVFETLYIEPFDDDDEDKIAEHKDLNDHNQTVWVKVTKKPNTGILTRMTDSVNQTRGFVVLGGVTVIILGAWGFTRLKKQRKMRF